MSVRAGAGYTGLTPMANQSDPPAPTPDPVLRPFADLAVWERRGERAPHKPLLVLHALGRWAAGRRDPVPYAEVERPLRSLLREYVDQEVVVDTNVIISRKPDDLPAFVTAVMKALAGG
jgi:hypothetical protein